MNNIDALKEKFITPPALFRSAPFWSWNDKLLPDEIENQAREMKKKGMGGFFMHSRDGLETEYMSDEWFDCIKTAVKTAKEEGIHAWLYDEDRWPSGSAGGIVPGQGDRFKAKALTIEVKDSLEGIYEEIVALFKIKLNGTDKIEYEKIDYKEITDFKNAGKFIVFRKEVSKKSEWFNDDAYSDNLNPDAVEAFITSTYEKYKSEVGEEFGKTIPGIFTDEPNVCEMYSKYTEGRGFIPWTEGFEEYFINKRGYDIVELLPYIFFDGNLSCRVRHDYWRTLSDRFSETYSKKIGEWCEENHLNFTGHYLWEGDLGIATRMSGAIMPHYRYQHIPGIDMLCEQTIENITIRQCTSVANQYERKNVLTETYGCTGWDFNFEGQKWIGDWQFVQGVNLRCPHLALYSLKGCRKRDYPPSFNYNTSWWKYNKIVEDYFARLGSVLSEGKIVRDVLLLHPQSTIWSMMGADPYYDSVASDEPNVIVANCYSSRYNELVKNLLAEHYDFDFGDETIIEEKGFVNDGKIFVNKAGYSLVVIPEISSIFKSTLKLFIEFLNTGGKVIMMEPLPIMVEGLESSEISDLLQHNNLIKVSDGKSLCKAIEENSPRKVSIRKSYTNEASEFMYLLKDLSDSWTLFIINNDRMNSHEVQISLEFKGKLEEWDPLTGETSDVGSTLVNNRLCFNSNFGPAGSKLYIISKIDSFLLNKLPISDNCNKGTYAERKIHTALGPVCNFTRTLPNSLVLDKCSFKVNNGKWSDEMDVWRAQREVRKNLGMRDISGYELPQRYKWINESCKSDGSLVIFKFYFSVEDVPENITYLALEDSKYYDIQLNGVGLGNIPNGWFIDKSLDKIELKGIHKGINELILSCNYLNRMEFEDCYIIGDFGVDIERNIVKEHKTLRFGDWCLQGYPNYCGSMVYHLNFDYQGNETAILELGDYSATHVEISVNEKIAGQIPWKCANQVNITKYLKQGLNFIDIEVMGSLRNFYGPFHDIRTNSLFIGCDSFRRENSEYTPEYLLKPYGLIGQVSILKEGWEDRV